MARLINWFFRLRGTNYVTHLSPMHSPFHFYEFTLKSFADFTVAEHWFDVCEIYHVPAALHAPLRWWMKRHDSGMQLTVFLRKDRARRRLRARRLALAARARAVAAG